LNLSHRDIEDLLAEYGIPVSHGDIWLWLIKIGSLDDCSNHMAMG